MKKDYQAPELEFVSLIADEAVTSKDMLGSGDIMDGDMSAPPSIFG